jgi:hypothetical protein
MKDLNTLHGHDYKNGTETKPSEPSILDQLNFLDQLSSSYENIRLNPLLHRHKRKTLSGRRSMLQRALVSANKTIEKTERVINKIKSRDLSCINRAKSIPKNATIRQEYVNCGKVFCIMPHGPYFYAYWKDPQTKKLKKKYIGIKMPDEQTKVK